MVDEKKDENNEDGLRNSGYGVRRDKDMDEKR